ncbi:MAG: extensin family protein [Deltaproteobacteria bacterium]|nr:extensin family protein [Deltaproteobacteria bacterium]
MKPVSASILMAIVFGCMVAFGADRATATAPDKDGLDNLIHSLQYGESSGSTAQDDPSAETISDSSQDTFAFSDVTVPHAHLTWQLSDAQCMEILNKADIKTHPPAFATPFVKTPLLLDSDIEGVIIDSKWPQKQMRRVMDCRLIVSLIQLARRARQAGVVKIEYYSTWRPITVASDCPDGVRGLRCRQTFERAQAGKLPSQHSRATAIDMRWFTFEDGSVVDVLEHYEMNFHEPPCDDHPITREGQFLQQLACDLHGDRVFNVMLTPNADRDHVNHFHFDITPNVTWYILR